MTRLHHPHATRALVQDIRGTASDTARPSPRSGFACSVAPRPCPAAPAQTGPRPAETARYSDQGPCRFSMPATRGPPAFPRRPHDRTRPSSRIRTLAASRRKSPTMSPPTCPLALQPERHLRRRETPMRVVQKGGLKSPRFVEIGFDRVVELPYLGERIASSERVLSTSSACDRHDPRAGTQPRLQFGRRNRLGQEIVRPGGQTLRQVAGVRFGRQQDDVLVALPRAGTQATAELRPGHARHHPVRHDQADARIPRDIERLLASAQAVARKPQRRSSVTSIMRCAALSSMTSTPAARARRPCSGPGDIDGPERFWRFGFAVHRRLMFPVRRVLAHPD
jgi:hypothetical protein